MSRAHTPSFRYEYVPTQKDIDDQKMGVMIILTMILVTTTVESPLIKSTVLTLLYIVHHCKDEKTYLDCFQKRYNEFPKAFAIYYILFYVFRVKNLKYLICPRKYKQRTIKNKSKSNKKKSRKRKF